jgi:hypothetical protein
LKRNFEIGNEELGIPAHPRVESPGRPRSKNHRGTEDTEKARSCPRRNHEDTKTRRNHEAAHPPKKNRGSTLIRRQLPTDHTDDMTAGWPWQPSRNVILSEGAKRPSRRICVPSDPPPILSNAKTQSPPTHPITQTRGAAETQRGPRSIPPNGEVPAVERPGTAGSRIRFENELSYRILDPAACAPRAQASPLLFFIQWIAGVCPPTHR